jgi:hypothetical protein
MEYCLSVDAKQSVFIKEEEPLQETSVYFLIMNHSNTQKAQINKPLTLAYSYEEHSQPA